jgi:hypothetical protein
MTVYVTRSRKCGLLLLLSVVVKKYACCAKQIFITSTYTVEKVGFMLHVEIMEKINISLSYQLIIITLHVYNYIPISYLQVGALTGKMENVNMGEYF